MPTGWPEVLVGGITIAFFVVTSLSTKMITDTLISPAFIDNRKLKLFGGILLVVFFWLLMSMPTNTHTFFYNDQIGAVITKDIETTNKYLSQIVNRGDVLYKDTGFLQDKYPASFWYYVILSIQVDVAAFIFFDIAFKRDDNIYN